MADIEAEAEAERIGWRITEVKMKASGTLADIEVSRVKYVAEFISM